MPQSAVSSIIVRVGASLWLLACASTPQPEGQGAPEPTGGAASAAEPQASRSSAGRSQPPRRLDGTFPELVIVGRMPGSTERAQRFLDVSVYIGVDGRPEMETLRVTGAGEVENRDAIRRWIEGASFDAGKDGLGRPTRGQYRVRIRVGG